MEKWTRLLVVLATSLLLLAFVAVAIRLSLIIHHTLLLFALGGLVAYALDPLVERLSRGKMKRQAAVGIVFVGLLALFGLGVLARAVSSISRQRAIHRTIRATRTGQRPCRPRWTRNWPSGTSSSVSLDTINHPPPECPGRHQEGRGGSQGLPIVRRGASRCSATAIIVLLIALYFLIFGSDMREKFNGMLPTDLSNRADLWETDVNRILGGFVRGQFVIAFITGVAAALGLPRHRHHISG